MPAANSFGKHLSDTLNNDARPADKPGASDRPSQAQDQYKARQSPATPSRPDAPKATSAAQAKDKPEKTDGDKSAAQNPAPATQSSKTAKVAATAQNSDGKTETVSGEPTDFVLNLAADPAAATAQPASLSEGTALDPKATKTQPEQKTDAQPTVAAIVNGLAPGALAITALPPVQNIEQAAPSSQGKAAAAEVVAPLEMAPAAAGLLAEAAKLSKNMTAGAASPAGPLSADETDISTTEPLPAAFAELVAAAKGLHAAKPEAKAQAVSIKPETTPAPTAMPALDSPKAAGAVEGAVVNAESGAKPEAGASLTALTPNTQEGQASAKSQPTPDAAHPVTLAAAPPPESVSIAPGKAEMTVNPLPFATLGAPGQTSLQIAQVQTPGSDRGPVAAGQAYVAAHVSLEITRTVNEGGNQFSIRLDPAELGRVDVKLHFGGDGRVTAAVSADNQNTLDLLRRDASLLDRALQDSGLKTDQGSLSFSLRQQGQQWQGQQAFLHSNQDFENQAMPAAEDVIAPAIASARSYVSNRALDITV